MPITSDITKDVTRGTTSSLTGVSDTGFLLFDGAGSFSSAGAGTAWSNPGNALDLDASFATVSLLALNDESQELTAVNLAGTPVPSGSVIKGIEARAWIGALANDDLATSVIQLVKGGTAQGDNKSVGDTLKTTIQPLIFGGPNELWGLTLSDTDVNAINFGFIIQVKNVTGNADLGAVDCMDVKIYYT